MDIETNPEPNPFPPFSFAEFWQRVKMTFGEDINTYFELRDKIDSRSRWNDFFFMLRSTGFVGIPTFLSGFVFLLLPQGRDTLLMVIEDMSVFKLGPFFCLLLGILLWSGAAELAVRYSLAIADLSGDSLSDERVRWRKYLQKIFSEFFLFWPSLVLAIGLLTCVAQASYLTAATRVVCFLILAAALTVITGGLFYLYLHWQKGLADGRTRLTRLGRHSIEGEEKRWLDKLYGIYNEFVFSLPKPNNFKGKYKDLMTDFDEAVMNSKDVDKFPQQDEDMYRYRKVPDAFELLNEGEVRETTGDEYKWRYFIPPGFYAQLHGQLKIMITAAALLFLVMAFTPAACGAFGIIGAPALLCFAFASYTGLYSGLLYLDYVVFRRFRFSARLSAFVLLVLCSYFNNDHPVRMSRYRSPERPGLLKQFDTWSTDYRQTLENEGRIQKDSDTIPVIFICAEGGALRTGAYTSMFLTKLQERLNSQHIDFKKAIFAMSGVSGGSLGLSYYNAKAFGRQNREWKQGSDTTKARDFFLYDGLSPVVAKLLFGDFLNLFIPWHIENLDRAIALEKSWENAYRKTMDRGEENRFVKSFIDNHSDPLRPVLLINTTEIETGYQCWISNVVPDSMPRVARRDLLAGKVNGINYSTGVNFSTRFPIFSPGGEVPGIACSRYHYLDGGYVENTGTGSMFELLTSLQKYSKAFAHVRPIVITLRFSDNENDGVENIRFGNEVTEIINGIYNTRVGRSFMAMDAINHFVHERGGFILDEPLTANEREVPMNWVLSEQSMQNLMGDINHKLDDSTSGGIIGKLADPKLLMPGNRPMTLAVHKLLKADSSAAKAPGKGSPRAAYTPVPTTICPNCLIWKTPYYLSIADTAKHKPHNTYFVYTKQLYREKGVNKVQRTGAAATWGTPTGISNEDNVYSEEYKLNKTAGAPQIQRGHCQPWVMLGYSLASAITSNTLTFNCAMEYAKQNNGTEKASEERVRKLIEAAGSKIDSVQVWCGTFGDGKVCSYKGVSVTMPLFYYKVLKYRNSNNKDTTECYLMPNKPDQDKSKFDSCHITYAHLKEFLKFDPTAELGLAMLKETQNNYPSN